jgi:DNA-binding XRE family transcriptional regulator
MIYTEAEYKRALKQVEDSIAFWANERKKLTAKGLKPIEIDRLLSPSMSIVEDLKNDIDWYEQAKKGKFLSLTDIESIGKALIALRISRGLTQEEFARKLEVSQKQVSRDEVNEYHAVSVDRVATILRVFGVTLESRLIPRVRRAA